MATWDAVNGRLSNFLDDNPVAGGSYLHAIPLRIAAWNWAQRALLAHTRREMTTTLTLGADHRQAPLPADLLDVMMIYDTLSFQVYARRQLFDQRGLRSNTSMNYAYWLWGGVIYFDVSVPNATLSLDYLGSWPEVTFSLDADDEPVVNQGEIYVPDWAELPLLHLTAATILQPKAIQAAMTRTNNITIDSGKPEDNSRRVQAREHFWWYTTLLSLVPPQVRGYGAN